MHHDASSFRYFAGIDMSKKQFDVSTMDTTDQFHGHQVFQNGPKGFTALLKWISTNNWSPVLFGMESTGYYGVALAKYLYGKGQAVTVCHAGYVYHFRKSRGWEQKTDYTDSMVIGMYLNHTGGFAYKPPSPTMEQLRHLVSCRRRVVQQAVSTGLFNQSSTSAIKSSALADYERYQRNTIKSLNKQILDLISQDELLKQQVALLCTIPGIGRLTACTFLVYSGDVSQYRKPGSLVSMFGLNPCPQESGQKIGKAHMSKRGNSHMRALLYNCAGAVIRMSNRPNPKISQAFLKFITRRSANGQHKYNYVACAVMRKLVILMRAILLSGKPYDINHGVVSVAPDNSQGDETDTSTTAPQAQSHSDTSTTVVDSTVCCADERDEHRGDAISGCLADALQGSNTPDIVIPLVNTPA